MYIRITAEYESADLAEIVSKRIKDTVRGVKKTSIIYNRDYLKAERLERGKKFTLIPTAVTTYNYFTAVVEAELPDNYIDEPKQRKNAYIYVICEETAEKNVKALLSSFGGGKITVSKS